MTTKHTFQLVLALVMVTVMAAAVSLLRALLPASLPTAVRLLLMIACGAAVYPAWLAVFHRLVLVEGMGMLRTRRRAGGGEEGGLSPPSS